MRLLFWYYLLYSLCGFCTEVLFARLTRAKQQTRKCRLILPLCPVYGLGGLMLYQLPSGILRSPMLLFFCGTILATVAEYLTGLFYSRMLRVRFWDYSNRRWHLHGQICLPFSLLWGGLSLFFVFVLQPILATLTAQIPAVLTLPAFYLYLLDTAISFSLLYCHQTSGCLSWLPPLRRRLKSLRQKSSPL